MAGPERPWRRSTADSVRVGRPSRSLIDVAGLSYRYARGEPRLVDISLRLRSTDMCVVLGPNGAGKSTLLRCLLGMLTPDRGTIRVAGANLAELSPRTLGRIVAYVPQAHVLAAAVTTLDVAVMGRRPHLALTESPSVRDRRAALDVLGDLGIDHLAGRDYSELSCGERQLALIARALVQETPVLLLDEPTSALDYGNEVHVLGVIARLATEGRAILMTTHRPDQALAYANRAVLLRDGSVLADGVPHKVVTSASLSDLYGTPIHVTGVPLPGPGGRVARACVPVQPTADTVRPATPRRT